jgi:hypothetical protein
MDWQRDVKSGNVQVLGVWGREKGRGREGGIKIEGAQSRVISDMLLTDDFFSGDDSLFASFDLDEAIQSLGRNRAVASPLGGEPTRTQILAVSQTKQKALLPTALASIQKNTATVKAWNWPERPRNAVAGRQQMLKAIKQSKVSEGSVI